MDTVHILKSGLAMCGIAGVPASWPIGNKWLAFNDNPMSKATCQKCRNSFLMENVMDVPPQKEKMGTRQFVFENKAGTLWSNLHDKAYVNDPAAITYAVVDMETLWQFIRDRRKAYEGRRESDYSFPNIILWGEWMADSCANFAPLDIAIQQPIGKVKLVMNGVHSLDTVKAMLPELYVSWSMGSRSIPNLNEMCDECGDGWVRKNARDFIVDEINDKGWHIGCLQRRIDRNSKISFEKVFREAGFVDAVLRSIPNQYWGDNPGHPVSPWFKVYTKEGCDLIIGWRKRVIQIEWLTPSKEATDMYIEAFKGENVTKRFDKDDCHIHAYGHEKSVEYLSKIRVIWGRFYRG